MTDDIRYVAGAGLLLGNGDRWLLVADVPDAAADDLWRCLTAPEPVVDAVRDLVVRRFGEDPPALALVDLQDDDGQTLTRGAGEITREVGVHRLAIGASAGGRSLPFRGGIVRACAAEVRTSRPQQRAPVPPAPATQASTNPAPAASPDLIDGIPAAILNSSAPDRPAPPAAARPPASEQGSTVVRGGRARRPAEDDPDHDGRTTHRPERADHLHQSTHETVLAVRCVQGHLTPPYSVQCRVCAAEVSEQEPERVARPSLGRLRLPTGEQVQLDRGVVLGRRPAPLPDGDEWPHLVQLPSDSTYLSRVHLEIRLDGWLVMARDLGSRGGTTLKVPGHAPQRIRAHEPYVLEPGHVLDLADVYAVVMEAEPE